MTNSYWYKEGPVSDKFLRLKRPVRCAPRDITPDMRGLFHGSIISLFFFSLVLIWRCFIKYT